MESKQENMLGPPTREVQAGLGTEGGQPAWEPGHLNQREVQGVVCGPVKVGKYTRRKVKIWRMDYGSGNGRRQ